MDWREKWEQSAADENTSHDGLSADDLLGRLKTGRYGRYYTLWSAIGRRGTLAQFGWPLMDVLRSKATYLHRYHCARALLHLMGETRFEAVHLSGDIPGRGKNLDLIEDQLVKCIGASQDGSIG